MRFAKRARDVLREIPIKDLMNMVKKAADLYTKAELPLGNGTQSPELRLRFTDVSLLADSIFRRYLLPSNAMVNPWELSNSQLRGIYAYLYSTTEGATLTA